MDGGTNTNLLVPYRLAEWTCHITAMCQASSVTIFLSCIITRNFTQNQDMLIFLNLHHNDVSKYYV